MAVRTQKSARRLTHLPARLADIPVPPSPAPEAEPLTEVLQIPPDQMSPGALQGMIEEFVTRNGTDYGERETELAKKVAQVKSQVQKGQADIFFYPDSELFQILPKAQFPEGILNN